MIFGGRCRVASFQFPFFQSALLSDRRRILQTPRGPYMRIVGRNHLVRYIRHDPSLTNVLHQALARLATR